MKKWLKRIRGAVGMGLTWAATWSVVGTLLWWAANLLIVGNPSTFIGPFALTVGALVIFGEVGFIGGAIFSVVLGIAEGRRRFDQMSLPRFAAWGALAGLLMSMLALTAGSWQMVPQNLIILSLMPLMGAGSSAGSLALARRADPLLESGERVGLIKGASPDPST